MRQVPSVHHPYIHPEYIKTFLSEDKIKNSSSYMLPSYENYDKRISFYNHQNIIYSPLTFKRSICFIKVTFKSFSLLMKECNDQEKTVKKHEIHQNVKKCAEYIQFDGTTKKEFHLIQK